MGLMRLGAMLSLAIESKVEISSFLLPSKSKLFRVQPPSVDCVDVPALRSSGTLLLPSYLGGFDLTELLNSVTQFNRRRLDYLQSFKICFIKGSNTSDREKTLIH